jgi:SAM-dependent methyltransferase
VWQGSWQTRAHAERYNMRHEFSLGEQVLLELIGKYDVREVVDLGCATGEFYRLLKKRAPSVRYRGYDVSSSGIAEARKKFPEGSFSLCRPDLSDIAPGECVYSQDVVHHQLDPLGFVRALIGLSERFLIVRLRTRDVGATVTDWRESRQLIYEQWVPHIVVNFQEFLDFLAPLDLPHVRIIKRPKTLSRTNGRFVPEDLAHSGGSATTLIASKVNVGKEWPPISIETVAAPKPAGNRLTRLLHKVASRFR